MNYKEFVEDNPKGYWFKRKWYGWGWTPVKWQGWVATLLYTALILVISFTLVDENSTDREVIFGALIPIAILTALFIAIAYKTGESPRWQWGPPKDDK